MGLTEHQDGITLPANYTEKDAVNMIPPLCDANGDNKIDAPFLVNENITIGANHAGYYGFRDSADITKLLDDGAIII